MARYDFIAVYLMASRRNGTLYLGVTSDLLARATQHSSGQFKGFAANYGCTRLVWFERSADMPTAIAREKELKKWRRAWKLALIATANPQWLDLYEDFLLPRDARRPELDD
ncbi:MAG: GIY-YIG nuclease family protein [Alphaproteobacteria bacterium]|nr:GIY-YIG nuclease family protein [Alphaproteobacteria bacterium]